MNLARCALRSFFRDCRHVAGWTVFEEVVEQQGPVRRRSRSRS